MAALTPDHRECLVDGLDKTIQILGTRPWSDNVYLAGSAALALYLGHRPIRGLDLMGQALRLASAERRDLLEDLLALEADCEVETARDGYMFVRSGNGSALRFFYYPYPLIDREEFVDGLCIASLMDLALMKLGAIISRGTRRDFVDLFLICKELPLPDVLARSADKFGHVRDFQLQALKGLADLSLVEGDPMPALTHAVEWSEVEEWLTLEVATLGRAAVGLSGPG